MGANTKIEWTATRLPDGTSLPGFTFNHVRGCTKLSEGCRFCYAETLSARNPATLGQWGPKGPRSIAAESYWKQPVAWNKEAEKSGVRRRVFCASLADVFEGQDTMPAESWPAVQQARYRLFRLIFDTPHLDWLLLTKRPENWQWLLAFAHTQAWGIPQVETPFAVWLENWLADGIPPENVWMGTSVENQKTADERIPHLLKIPAKVRFLSMEPLLGPVDIEWALNNRACMNCSDWEQIEGKECPCWEDPNFEWKKNALLQATKDPDEQLLHWVIVGGESGPNSRPMHPEWARSLRDQCNAASVPFFLKQWGEWAPFEAWATLRQDDTDVATQKIRSHKFYLNNDPLGYFQKAVYRIGKKRAGRLLDGRTWDEYPRPEAE